MTMRHIYSWQHQSTSRGRWALKRLLMELISHLGKKLFLSGLLDELDMQDPQRNDCWTRLRWDVHQGSCFMKESARHSAEYRRKWLASCQYWQNCLWNFLLHGKVCWILWVCRLKMDATTVKNNFGWLSRQGDVSFISRVLEVAYNVLPVYLGNVISFWSLWWSWRICSYNYSFP